MLDFSVIIFKGLHSSAYGGASFFNCFYLSLDGLIIPLQSNCLFVSNFFAVLDSALPILMLFLCYSINQVGSILVFFNVFFSIASEPPAKNFIFNTNLKQ
jgi:hypothetical protein